ncbi:hypothetical protein Sjap_023079 [Stephania japonica]|uniref:Uncharacterized protein n=1 Tax=Stephania japonica TaxID=461633 RepID=A0AAP0ET43_9MAGN
MFSLQLRDWLDLSLNHALPSSLLILSRAFTVSGKLRPEEAVMSTMSSLPDELVDTVQVTSMPSEDSVSERRRKLEFLEMQEEFIKDDIWCIGWQNSGMQSKDGKDKILLGVKRMQL